MTPSGPRIIESCLFGIHGCCDRVKRIERRKIGRIRCYCKKNASFRFLWREKGERGWRVWRLLTTTATTTTELDLNNEYISTFGRPEHFDTNPWRGRVMADVWGESFMTGICIYIYTRLLYLEIDWSGALFTSGI